MYFIEHDTSFSSVQTTSQASLRQQQLPCFTLTPWKKNSDWETDKVTKASWSFLSWQKRRARVSSKVLYKTQWKTERKMKDRVTRELAVSRATGTKKKSAAVMWWRGRCGEVEDKCCGVSQALAALEFVALLPVSGWRDTYVHYIVARRLIVCRSVRYLLLWHNAVDFCRGEFK